MNGNLGLLGCETVYRTLFSEVLSGDPKLTQWLLCVLKKTKSGTGDFVSELRAAGLRNGISEVILWRWCGVSAS